MNPLPARNPFVVLFAACVITAGGFSKATAAPVLNVSQSSFTGLQPGGIFSLTLTLTNPGPIELYAYDFFLSADSDGIFQVIGQSLTSPLDVANYLEPISLENPYAVNAPGIDDLGARSASTTTGFIAGTAAVQVLTFRVLPNAASGAHLLSFSWDLPLFPAGGPGFVDLEGTESQMSNPINVSVQIVPEPGAAILFLGGVLLSLFTLRARFIFLRTR